MKALILLALAGALVAAPAAAQDRPGPAVEFAGGALLFVDDATKIEPFVGGAARFYVTPRVSIGPEVAYSRGDNRSHLMVTGNVTFDLLGPGPGGPRSVTPFLVIGGGFFQTRERFFDDAIFKSGEGAFTAGGGARARIGQRLIAGGEARFGWELHWRVNGFVGVQLGP
jgi:hypothetical protein